MDFAHSQSLIEGALVAARTFLARTDAAESFALDRRPPPYHSTKSARSPMMGARYAEPT
jgi:hypothetical protein